MEDNEIGSFYLCVNPESDDTGGLFLDDCVSFETSKQELLRQIPSTNPLIILYEGYLGDGLSMCLEEVVGLEMLLENDGGLRYEAESLSYNSAFDGFHHPKAIVFPTTEEQVQKIVLCKNKARIRICTRAGGHS